LGLANRRDWTPRRLSSYLNPWFSTRQGRVMGCASCGSDGSCRTPRRCRSSRSRCNGVAQHVQADACNPDFCFQRWAPEPREITATDFEPAFDGERTVSPRHTRFGGPSFCRNRRAPNLWRPVTNVGQPLVPGTSDSSSRIFAAALWCNRAASRFGRAFHPCPSRRRPARDFARLDPRIRPKASAILTTHGHARRSSRLPTA